MKNLTIGDVGISTVVESLRVPMAFAEFLPQLLEAREVLEAARPWLEPRFASFGTDPATSVGFLDFHTYVVRTPRHVILIDTCIGDDKERGGHKYFHKLKTPWLANLRAAGLAPEQVDYVMCTHMHADHVGGLMEKSALAFPNAVLRINKADTDYWLSEANMNAAPEGAKGFFQGAMASVNPYVAAGKLKTFEGNAELIPGVRAVEAFGHTPGHTIYAVESKGEKLMLWGDLMHVAAVQFDKPSVTIQFDSNSTLAEKSREKAFADAAKNGYVIGLSHIAFPGLGHLRATPGAKGYTWVPLNYSSLK